MRFMLQSLWLKTRARGPGPDRICGFSDSGQGSYFVITGQTSNHSRRWSSIHFDDSLGPHDFVS